jgi:hypothetical protein
LDSREYEESVESLHRCFDSGDPNSLSGSLEEKSLLPYAVLHLAILEFHFGHIAKALQALNEAIQISQERNDDECLTYALAISVAFQQKNNINQQLIEKCIQRAKQLKLSNLSSLNYLTLAKNLLQIPFHSKNSDQRKVNNINYLS